MERHRIILFIFIMLCFWGKGLSQNIKTARSKIIIPDSCHFIIDSFIIDPLTFDIEPSIKYNIVGNIIKFDCQSEEWKNRMFRVSYRILASDLHLPFYNLDTTKSVQLEKAIQIGNGYSIPINRVPNSLINPGGVNYNGSISRGFSVGNSQSLVLNSNLNLQLNGNLGNGIEVLAAISDDNIPIQANGNTQLLQEFDKVFIKISKNKTDIIAGDYDISNGSQSYFTRYYKKLQGLRVDNTSKIGEGILSTSSNIAVSRGKFSRQILNVREGNQGPYKLLGNNGERFLIVLQGSERVYYDGVLLTRGQDYDYIIDYNNAEIIFTPRILIRIESRIIVEYEYTDQNYLRSLYAINSEYLHKDYKLFFNIYNEQDSKNARGQIELDSTDIALLSMGEDNSMGIIRTGIREINPASASENTIYYLLEIAASGDTILNYISDYQEDAVTAFFSEVQLGQGDYRISSTIAANGRVYEYVGKGNGNYLPVIQLIAPEKRQLISIGGEINVLDNGKIKVETSLSNFDNNRFSNQDNALNQGMASKLSFDYNKKNQNTEEGWKPRFHTTYETLNKNYNSLNPFRNQEFIRDWNINLLEKTREQLVHSKIGIHKGSSADITYEFSLYDRENQFRGYRHLPKLEYKTTDAKIIVLANILNTKGILENSAFIRPIIDLSKRFVFLNNWSLRFKYLGEKNERTSANTGDLNSASFAFDEYYFYINSPDNEVRNASFFLKQRIDRLPQNSLLTKANVINEAGLSGNFRTDKTGLLWNITYRNFEVKNQDLVNTENTSTLLGRLDYSFNIKNGFIRSVSSFNIGSGQEARREYQFIKVEKGEGTYLYLGDLNSDGQNQINEYEVAVFTDQADYIRVNVVNNEFIRTENQGINQSLRISPHKLFGDNRAGWKNILSKITTTSIIKLDQKRLSDSGSNGGFLAFNSNDTTTVSFNALVNNILFFNRGNPKYDLQLGHRYTNNRFVQITGFEQRNTNLYFIKTRYNPYRSFDIINNFEWGIRNYDSEFFDNKDLDMNFISLNPKLVFRPSSRLRFTTQYVYEKRNQMINDLESSRSHEINIETTWRQASTSSLNASLSLVDINYNGDLNTPVSYAILEGLNNGNNFLWNLSMTRRMSGNVDLLLSYEGRKTGDSQAVHIGRVQVRANF